MPSHNHLARGAARMTDFQKLTGAKVPLICGPMYPCSNPELVAAVSAAGGMGVVQPLSMTFVYKRDLREGLKFIRSITPNPYGFNILTEASSKIYIERNKKWLDVALEEGCRFFITALGNPRWIVDRVKPLGGVVFHDVTERKWADKALQAGVDGFICVNNRAGGHTGRHSPEELIDSIGPLGRPLVCAGGVGDPETFVKMLRLGYSAVQMGTRFIATSECAAHADYKSAILKATSDDIVLTERLTGVPVSIIRTPAVERQGTKAGPFMAWLLRHPRFKHWARLFFSLTSFGKLKKAHLKGGGYLDYWQAGKSVDGIESIESAGTLVRRFSDALLHVR